MRINIASSGGRFHLLDLAKVLKEHGHEVNFYSYVPTKRAIKFGLKKECSKSYFVLALPFLFLIRVTKHSFWSLYLFHRLFDYYVAWIMKPCDVFIGHSPMHVYALKYARKKYGAKIILERGTSHVYNYIEALTKEGKQQKEVMPDMFLKRDLLGYDIADYISIASTFVKNTFIDKGVNEKKLFVNPYGVEITDFYPTQLENTDNNQIYDLLFVGQWSKRKSADIIVEICKRRKLKLLHVGSLLDVPFPSDSNFTDIGIVEEKELIEYYKKAKVFILPSREDGFGLVLIQAMICGLPIVCSQFTGGPDLRDFLSEDKSWIISVDIVSEEEIEKAIDKALEKAKSQIGIRNYVGDDVKNITWEAYGNRYNEFLKKIVE